MIVNVTIRTVEMCSVCISSSSCGWGGGAGVHNSAGSRSRLLRSSSLTALLLSLRWSFISPS